MRIIHDDVLDALDYFAPGMKNHVAIISYEVISPDMSMLNFATTGQNGENYHFSLLFYDSMFTIKHARKIISATFARVEEFISPIKNRKAELR